MLLRQRKKRSRESTEVSEFWQELRFGSLIFCFKTYSSLLLFLVFWPFSC